MEGNRGLEVVGSRRKAIHNPIWVKVHEEMRTKSFLQYGHSTVENKIRDIWKFIYSSLFIATTSER